ncbi:MAG: 5'-methylthioadenosine/adenosylhomocysteine nucleosidase [Parcubacteria group bacterium]|nr:5'-methylthioadenosine/adenosylhomocysteine nucleosidase [Parcubacteria group bacterium]
MSIHILAAMAEELAAIDPSLSAHKIGVGKVNAALATCGVLAQDADAESIVLVVGTAAACDPSLKIGDVVIATGTGHHDMDVTALNFAPGQIPFEEKWFWKSDERLVQHTTAVCQELGLRHSTGHILTGDQFVTDPARVAWIHETFGAACIEMETAAVAQVCHRFNSSRHTVRWLGIRVISDLADKSAPVDFQTFLPQAAQTIGRIINALLNNPG